MSIGSALQQSAAQLFALHGYQVSFSRPDDTNGATYDTTTGTMTGAGAPLTWTGVGFYVDYMSEDIDDSSIKIGDRKLLVQAQSLERAPQINDTVDSTLTVVNVRQVRSGSTITHYACQTRG